LSVAVSHDGAWVVSGSKDRGVQFWDSESAIVQCMLQGHKNSGEFLDFSWFSRELIVDVFPPVISIDLSPAGSILATGSGDWQARICTFPDFYNSKFRLNFFFFFCRELLSGSERYRCRRGFRYGIGITTFTRYFTWIWNNWSGRFFTTLHYLQFP
jgi:WD40 repeat protein